MLTLSSKLAACCCPLLLPGGVRLYVEGAELLQGPLCVCWDGTAGGQRGVSLRPAATAAARGAVVGGDGGAARRARLQRRL